mmetsp:Transcript_2094/g.3865  ORF Transcript_2094/g.3865 Transcript_2094/m.3865 type:complete len:238 (-) Transcript_2094:1798-2511(-)
MFSAIVLQMPFPKIPTRSPLEHTFALKSRCESQYAFVTHCIRFALPGFENMSDRIRGKNTWDSQYRKEQSHADLILDCHVETSAILLRFFSTRTSSSTLLSALPVPLHSKTESTMLMVQARSNDMACDPSSVFLKIESAESRSRNIPVKFLVPRLFDFLVSSRVRHFSRSWLISSFVSLRTMGENWANRVNFFAQISSIVLRSSMHTAKCCVTTFRVIGIFSAIWRLNVFSTTRLMR